MVCNKGALLGLAPFRALLKHGLNRGSVWILNTVVRTGSQSNRFPAALAHNSNNASLRSTYYEWHGMCHVNPDEALVTLSLVPLQTGPLESSIARCTGVVCSARLDLHGDSDKLWDNYCSRDTEV